MRGGGRRKKWSEAEEKSLIEKYGEMVGDGSLGKMKSREKKYRPIAAHVNSLHHLRDPITYPWNWSWKDVSTKVQNMRHQFLLVKQKMIASSSNYNWDDAISLWSNFLLYKHVFGDLPIPPPPPPNDADHLSAATGFLNQDDDGMEIMRFCHLGNSEEEEEEEEEEDGDFASDHLGGFHPPNHHHHEDDDEDDEDPLPDPTPTTTTTRDEDPSHRCLPFDNDPLPLPLPLPLPSNNSNGNNNNNNVSSLPKKTKPKTCAVLRKKMLGFLSDQLGRLKELEARFQHKEMERERDRQRRESSRMARELEWDRKWEEMDESRIERHRALEKLRERRALEWETLQNKIREEEEEEREREREFQERMSRKRSEWRKGIEGMLDQHRAEMGQMQARLLHEQQSLTNQLVGMISHWSAHSATLSDHASTTNHYLSQMMHNLHHVSGVHEDSRLDGDTQEDHFIVDG